MLSIGEFARRGRVSERMLRHYDAIGLLRPAHVNPFNSYRSYDSSQLGLLNQIVVLRELGFGLAEIASMLGDDLNLDELRDMFRLRKSRLHLQIERDSARLAGVEARLAFLESARSVSPGAEVAIKELPALRVAGMCAPADGFDPAFVTPVIGPLFQRLAASLERAGIRPVGPAVARYEDLSERDGLMVHAAMPIGDQRAPDDSVFTVTELPRIERAATILHHGSMDGVMLSIARLGGWIDASPYRSAGYNREVYLRCGADRSARIVELQEPLQWADAATTSAAPTSKEERP